MELLLEYWSRLLEALESPGGWSDSDASTALDLLAIPADLRSGWTPIDGPEGCDLAAFRRELVLEEIERLERLRDEALAPLDDLERRQAMTGDVALLSKQARLIQRYERDAWRRYRESIREVRPSASDPGPISKPVRSDTPSRPARQPVPTPAEKAPAPAGRPPDAPARSLAEERRALHGGDRAGAFDIRRPVQHAHPRRGRRLARRPGAAGSTSSTRTPRLASASFVPITVGVPGLEPLTGRHLHPSARPRAALEPSPPGAPARPPSDFEQFRGFPGKGPSSRPAPPAGVERGGRRPPRTAMIFRQKHFCINLAGRDGTNPIRPASRIEGDQGRSVVQAGARRTHPD